MLFRARLGSRVRGLLFGGSRRCSFSGPRSRMGRRSRPLLGRVSDRSLMVSSRRCGMRLHTRRSFSPRWRIAVCRRCRTAFRRGVVGSWRHGMPLLPGMLWRRCHRMIFRSRMLLVRCTGTCFRHRMLRRRSHRVPFLHGAARCGSSCHGTRCRQVMRHRRGYRMHTMVSHNRLADDHFGGTSVVD